MRTEFIEAVEELEKDYKWRFSKNYRIIIPHHGTIDPTFKVEYDQEGFQTNWQPSSGYHKVDWNLGADPAKLREILAPLPPVPHKCSDPCPWDPSKG